MRLALSFSDFDPGADIDFDGAKEEPNAKEPIVIPASTPGPDALTVPALGNERCDVARKAVTRKNSVSKKTAPNKKSAIKTSGRISSGAKAPRKSQARKPAKVRLPKGPVWQWSAVETAAAIRAGAISSVEVIDGHIERMRAVNPKLNAIVADLSEEALKAAKAADRARAKRTELGLLHGVPITIKENVDYEGRPNPNGVPAQMNIIAPSDAPVVFVEGAIDVLALRALDAGAGVHRVVLGLPGLDAWQPKWAELARGRTAYIGLDADAPGAAKCEEIADDLLDANGGRQRVVLLRPKGGKDWAEVLRARHA